MYFNFNNYQPIDTSLYILKLKNTLLSWFYISLVILLETRSSFYYNIQKYSLIINYWEYFINLYIDEY